MAVVRFLAPDTDLFVASVLAHAGEFTERTGLTLEPTILASDDFFANAVRDRLVRPGEVDVFTSGPVLLWQHVGAGLVASLDDHVAGASAAWDVDDFFPALLDANRWTGRFGDPLGQGPLREIPVNCESYNLAHLPDALTGAGVEVPVTWDAYFDAAAALASRGGVRGWGQRGIDVWHTMYTGYATQVWSCGGTDFDETGRSAIGSAAVVDATRAFVAALRASGPDDWPHQRWYELALGFAAGDYGLLVDSDHYAPIFEGSGSAMAGRIGYAMPPSGPAGRRPNLWTWSLAMNANASDPAAAWAFIEWASGPDFLLRSALEGNLNPTRRSTWDAPAFRQLVAGWGDYAAVSRRLLEDHARVLVTPHPEYLTLATRWVAALREAYAGADVRDALTRAAADIDRITGRA